MRRGLLATAHDDLTPSLLMRSACRCRLLRVHNRNGRGNFVIRVGAVANVDGGPNFDLAAPFRRWRQHERHVATVLRRSLDDELVRVNELDDALGGVHPRFRVRG